MSVIEWKKVETVAVITMNNGENRHNPEFIRAILKSLDEIEGDPMITSVIIASSDPKNWSQGIDLQWMADAMASNDLQGIRDFMYGLNRIFNRILLYPMPVIAAINGHAFGDGTILACANEEELMREAIAFAKSFNKKRPIYAEMKKRFHRTIIETMEKEDPVFIEPLQLMVQG